MKGTITITEEGNNDSAKRADERTIGVILKNCAAFTDCTSEINNTQIDNKKYPDIVMPLYNLIKYSDNYLKVTRSYLQFCRDEPNATSYKRF